MAGGTPKADLTNKFGSADALMLHTERDRLDSPFKGGNPPPGYSLISGPALKSPRLAATLQSFDSDHDLFSDQLEAYNRWNVLRTISYGRKAALVSTDAMHITDPGASAPMNSGTPDWLDLGYLLPPSGVGYRLNTFGMPQGATNFGTKGVVTTLELIGREWDRRYGEYLRTGDVDQQIPITRPYYIVGLLCQPGGGVIKNLSAENLKYMSGNGCEADFQYFKVGSDAAHDFVLSNGPTSPTDNSIETTEGFDLKNTKALIQLLRLQPQVTKIELDPYILELLPALKDDPRIVAHGSRDIKDSRRDLDNHMFVTFASSNVGLTVDSNSLLPNNGDRDSDGIPDFADNNITGQSVPDGTSMFTRLYIQIPSEFNLDGLKFRLTYSASDPSAVAFSAGPPPAYQLPPNGGTLRVWSKDGAEARNSAQIDANGNFIASGKEYFVSALPPIGSDRKITLYIESVKISGKPVDNQIGVEFLPVIDPSTTSSVNRLTASVSVSSAIASLAVDANRDGNIKFASEDSSDAITTDKPFRF